MQKIRVELANDQGERLQVVLFERARAQSSEAPLGLLNEWRQWHKRPEHRVVENHDVRPGRMLGKRREADRIGGEVETLDALPVKRVALRFQRLQYAVLGRAGTDDHEPGVFLRQSAEGEQVLL